MRLELPLERFPSPHIVTTFCEKGECLDQSRDARINMGGLTFGPRKAQLG